MDTACQPGYVIVLRQKPTRINRINTSQLKMKKVIPVILAAFLTGCGATSSVRVSIPPPDRVAFQFYDERSDEERTSRVEKSSLGSASFYGDDNLSPTAPDVFKSYLTANVAEKLSGKAVKLKTFVVSAFDPKVSIDGDRFNNAVSSVPNANPLGVMLAVPVIMGIESIRSQKVVSVTIRGTVDDKEYSSQCSNSFRGRATEDNVQTVVLACLEQFSGDIRAGNYSEVATNVSSNMSDVQPEIDAEAPTVNCVVNGERVWTKPSKCDL